MFLKECKKIFIRQYAVLFILVIIIMKIAVVYINGYDSHYMIDENEKYYLDYMQKYQGKLTKKHISEIENEYEKLIHEVNTDLIKGQKKNAFQVIYHQYLYAKEQKDGYIFDTRGWQSILTHDKIDYLLLLGIVVVSTIFFSNEFDSEMHILILTSKKGRYATTGMKMFLCCATSLTLAAIFQFIQYIYLNVMVGLPYAMAPLQSLEKFEGTQWNCSLEQALLYVFLLKIMGSLFVAVVSILIIVSLKKKVLSLISAVSLFFIADIVCGNTEFAYYLPLGMLKAAGYFFPSQYRTNINASGEFIKECTFKAIDKSNFSVCIVIFIIIIAVLFVVDFSVFSGRNILKRFFSNKKVCGYICMVAILLSISGCSKTSKITESIKVGDGEQTEAVTQENDRIFIDKEKNTLIIEHSGVEKPLLRNVFPTKIPICKIFVYEKKCFYLMENDEDSGVYIRCVDLKTYSDEFVYSDMDENTEKFYGLISDDKDTEEIFTDMKPTEWFFIADGYIFLRKENYVKRINIQTGASKIIADRLSDTPVVYDNHILHYESVNGKKIEN